MKRWQLVLWWWELILALAQVAVSVILMSSLVRMNILKWQWIVLIGVGLLVLLVLTILPLFFRKKPIIAWRIVGMIVSVTVLTGGVFALRYVNAFNGFLDKITIQSSEVSGESGSEETKIVEKKVTDEPFIIYISGSDSRTSVDDPGARSDVNIIAVVNPNKHKILLASIPRDTYVQLHGTTGLKDKLTHAGLAMYGPDMSKLTLEDFLGIKIDYTVKVSFDTVVGVVDELGGIEIYSDTKLWLNSESKQHPGKYCYFDVGTQWVDGDCALRFARERKSYYTGDRHRGENQQEVLTGIVDKLTSSRDYILRLPAILEIVGDSFITSFSREAITDFISFQLNEQVNWQIERANLDGEGALLETYTYVDDNLRWVMIPDEESLQNMKDKINEFLMVEDEA